MKTGQALIEPDRSDRQPMVTKRQYQILFELNPNPMFVFEERTFRFLAVNQAMVRLYGWSLDEFQRMTAKDIRPPEDMPLFLRELKKRRTAQTAFVGAWRHRKKDGSVFDVEVTISRMPFAGRNARLGMVNDVTGRRQAEETIGNLVRQLENRVKVRTAELRKSEERLLQQQRRLQQLAASLATARDAEQRRIAEGLHDDVAQLLAAASVRLATARGNVRGGETARLLRQAEALVTRANEKVRKLSFELTSSTLLRLGLREALAELCDTMQVRHDVRFRFKSASMQIQPDEATATVLFKSVRELMFNVVKHAGVTAASVSIHREGPTLKLVVEDRGKGFPATAKPVGLPGTGLGLFAMQERLRSLGGKMQIDTRPGYGTKVAIWISLSSQPKRRRT